MRKKGKTDANQAGIVEYLRRAGCRVLILSAVGSGCPDLLVGHKNKLALVEIKDGKKKPSARKLTPDQVKFHEDWKGYPIFILKDDADVVEFLR
jgi:Holliday junction resolvase